MEKMQYGIGNRVIKMREVSDVYNLVDNWFDENLKDNESVSVTPAGDAVNYLFRYDSVKDKNYYSDNLYIPYIIMELSSDQTIYALLKDILVYFRSKED